AVEQPGSGRKEKKTDFTNESQQNLMKIVEYLSTDVFRVVTTQEICDALGITKSKAYWTLQNLSGDGSKQGWVEQIADGWKLGPRLPRIAEKVRKGIEANIKQYLEVK
ncbi:MAG: hypothetical protein Q8M92_06440, partial [Candidatus Subteraquimicrobiales bacterium]|nr:hypothetical protein [Candidatus Subteraquimicrobiales bacterium]